MNADPIDEGIGPELNVLGKFIMQLAQYGQNASNNMQGAVKSMSPQSWLRLIAIVGGYMMMRPYVMKWASKRAVEGMEEADEREKADEKARMSANEFRGVKEKLIEQEEDEDAGEGTSSDWGQKARVRQRQLLKQMLEAEEERRAQDAEDDEDIKEFLLD